MDKSEERKVVEMVFGGHLDIEIEDSERPDFICRVSDSKHFGVEVTDFYFSESVARLRRIPNYATDLLTSNVYRHKDDKKRLPVEKVIYRRAETDEEREITAIVGEEHTADDVVTRISAAIAAKNEKVTGYATEIVDLILHDVDALSRFKSTDHLMLSIQRAKTVDTIIHTAFREIYLITKHQLDWVCVPLRANLFVAEILKFQELFKEHHRSTLESLTLGDYLLELARHLAREFPGIESEVLPTGQRRLILGSVAVNYDAKQTLETVDISIDLPSKREVLRFEDDDQGDTILHAFVRSKVDSVFACASIQFPARKSAHVSPSLNREAC